MPRRNRAGRSPKSVLTRVEEIVLASSGADAFELVFALVVARLFARTRGLPLEPGRPLRTALRGAARAWPDLAPSRDLEVPDAVMITVLALLERAALEGDAEGLDALFEQLVTRVGKGHKGQFFTPRHVVDFGTRALALTAGERFLDPACGSGAFVSHAQRAAKVEAWGYDVDARAVRVAKLLSIVTGADPDRIVRRDSLARPGTEAERFDVIATNPPFAGAPEARGYEVARLGGRVERDALFLERCLALLRPGGRLCIVLPHGKVASPAWAPLRRWVVDRARVLAVVSLPRETFLPYTSQRAALVFAAKRTGRGALLDERVFLGVSERAGRDAAGEPMFVRGAKAGEGTWRDHDHDLRQLERPLFRFLRAEGFC
jgi:type I restriction enzyme M protein